MKKNYIALALSLLGASAISAQPVLFVFNTSDNSINGNTTLADSHDSAVDGQIVATPFDLSSIVSGLILTITPSAGDDISYTTSGLGVNTGGEMDAAGEFLTFSFNQAVTLDFLEFGSFTGGATFEAGEDSALLGFSNSNPDIALVDADLNGSNEISFAVGTSLAADESFTISYVDGGGFNIEEIAVTVVPEPSSYALIAGFLGLTFIMLKRRSA